MRAALAILALLLFVPAALADEAHIPLRYASGPFLAPVEVLDLSPAEVDAFCNDYSVPDPLLVQAGARSHPAACALFGKGSDLGWELRFAADACTIFVIGPDSPVYTATFTYEGVVEHEKAHCRGWPPNHPD